MKTQDDIFKYLNELSRTPERDMFGYRLAVLVEFADWQTMEKILQLMGVREEGLCDTWVQTLELDGEVVLEVLRTKVSETWVLIVEQRGSSVFENIVKIEMLLWMLGDEELVVEFQREGNYGTYGMPLLRRGCFKYGFPYMFNMGVIET